MSRPVPAPIHLLDVSDLVACQGLDLEAVAAAFRGKPLRLTIYLEHVTCPGCRRWHAARQAHAGAA